jgi:hypothetical protein
MINDIKIYTGYSGGTCAYRIEGDKIYTGYSGGTCAYRIEGDKIYTGYSGGECAYRIEGDKIYTGYSGGTCAYRLEGISNSNIDTGSSSSSSSSGEKPGCLGMVVMFFGFIFLKLPIGGKICAIAGAVLPIIGAIAGGNGNNVLIAPFGFLIGGGIGALGNFVIPKLSKAGKLGTLIGAVVLGIAFEIMLFSGNVSTAFGNIVGFAVFGLIIGSILGAIIGSIVGFIQKKAGKKKE